MSMNSGLPAQRQVGGQPTGRQSHQPTSLADLLERVLDKGIIIAGDIKVDLLDIELLTIRIRLLVASVDKAQEMGIDWWRNDPMLSSGAQKDMQQLSEENRQLRERLEALEAANGNREVEGGRDDSQETDQEDAETEEAREAEVSRD